MRRALITALWLVSTEARAAPLPLQFVREHVELTVDERQCIVDGKYTITNRTDGSVGTVIDFPYLPGAVRAPELLELQGGTLLSQDAQHALIDLQLEAGQSAVLHIRYRHDFGPRRARYLVTTANNWGEPLQRAEFVVHAPKGWGAPHSLWGAPLATCDEILCNFTWTFAPFAPAAELDLTW